MRMKPAPMLVPAVLALALAACATAPGGGATAGIEIPPDAASATRIMANGDQVTEYRVAGQLQMVKVQPKHGRPYYLYDRNHDGRPDQEKGVSPVYFRLFEW